MFPRFFSRYFLNPIFVFFPFLGGFQIRVCEKNGQTFIRQWEIVRSFILNKNVWYILGFKKTIEDKSYSLGEENLFPWC